MGYNNGVRGRPTGGHATAEWVQRVGRRLTARGRRYAERAGRTSEPIRQPITDTFS